MITEIGSPDTWAQFGLAGLVIFALFTALVTIVIFTIKRLDKIDKRNTDAYLTQSSEHRTERREWREGSNRQADRFENALNNIAIGMRDNK